MARQLKPDSRFWWYDTLSLHQSALSKMNTDGLTYREAAEDIGINFTTISKLKSREPSIQTVTRLCQWLEIPIDTFVRRDGQQYASPVRIRRV